MPTKKKTTTRKSTRKTSLATKARKAAKNVQGNASRAREIGEALIKAGTLIIQGADALEAFAMHAGGLTGEDSR